MELCERPLEAELAAIAECAEPGRATLLAVRREGWGGSGGGTLETIGDEFGITRERAWPRLAWPEMALGADGRPLPEMEEDGPIDDPKAGLADPGGPVATP